MIKNLTKLLFICLTIWGCDHSETIENKDAIQLLNNKKYYFLDVRTLPEHEIQSIPNTSCIPVQEIGERLKELENQKNKIIVVYCRSGNRSSKATKILNDNGFNAVNLIGGMKEWSGQVTRNN
tara:strand:+ start:1631 stop:1999 length:369 start_codon:yes stop_codon:yes gene_type:complete